MADRALAALRRMSIVVAIAITFLFGLATTVYLSLRSPEVTVPDVVGKDRFEAENVLGGAGLNFRVRATRPNSEVKADTVLFQLPRAGEVVKAGQTVAMDISRTVREGEPSETVSAEKKSEDKAGESNKNVSSNINENRPKRSKDNKNANENSNANAGKRNANASPPPPSANSNNKNADAAANVNSNRPATNDNANSGNNQNQNKRPPTEKPSPDEKPKPENP